MCSVWYWIMYREYRGTLACTFWIHCHWLEHIWEMTLKTVPFMDEFIVNVYSLFWINGCFYRGCKHCVISGTHSKSWTTHLMIQTNTAPVIIMGGWGCRLHINLYASYSLYILLHAAVDWLLYSLHSPLFWFIINPIYCSCHGMSLWAPLLNSCVFSVLSGLAKSCELCSVRPEGLLSLLNH